ncbi:MAG: hypothetical protein SFT91_06355 [Rickettsiaceae bacterium]|nr:hypothetical protein [Rickettsiaceae bacterium]
MLDLWEASKLPSSFYIQTLNFSLAKEPLISFFDNILAKYTSVKSESNPDIIFIEPEKMKNSDEVAQNIKIDQIRDFRGDFCAKSGLSPYKFCVIVGAERMNLSASNALLKILEDPPKNSHIILITSSPAKLLPTIASRCIGVFYDNSPEISTREQNDIFSILTNKHISYAKKIQEIDQVTSKEHKEEDIINSLIESILNDNNTNQDAEFTESLIKLLLDIKKYNLDLKQALVLILSKIRISS